MVNELIAIIGPTAVGKTEISVALAEEIGGEIVSADSRQIYKYMDIGTAKPSSEDQRRIKHHMIDILFPDEEIDVATYSKMAREKIDDIMQRGLEPILVGGTGLYVRGVVDGIFEGPGKNIEIRKELKEIYGKDQNQLYFMLKDVDPLSAMKIHPNDRQRIIRALEIYYETGKSIAIMQKEHGFRGFHYRTIFIGLYRYRNELCDIINSRVDNMIKSGFIDEVAGLLQMGYSPSLNSMQGLGYRYFTAYLKNEISFKESVEQTKRDTRRYAKRQMTWFNKDNRIVWIKLSGKIDIKAIIENIKDLLCQKEEANV
ncbi:tRNA (adenosine(37)-N6)-dimethylallyltransferase MiaA [bacterium]|nr:tRNA (adenosine(37)-N6)-dimethylallyltransferase MiaA [bacterium]